MSNARTNQLHDKLPVELRQAVERDLVEQPPGRATYEEVYTFHDLEARGVSLKAVQRYGGYLRTLARNQRIREFGDVLLGEDLSPRVQSVIRSRLFEALTTGEELGLGDLLKASIAEKTLRESVIKAEEWEAKKAAALKAVESAEKEGREDPAKALANLTEKVRTLYGLALEPAAK